MERIKLYQTKKLHQAQKRYWMDCQSGGRVINIFKAMANSAATLKSFFGMHKALEEKVLDEATVERIVIQLAVMNGCEYCLQHTHTQAQKLLSDEELIAAREGKSSERKSSSPR